MEGVLSKWCKYRWKNRYYVLVNNVLKEFKKLGSPWIWTYHISLITISPHKKNGRKFKLNVGTGKISLRATSSNEAQQWFDTIYDA